MFFGCGGLLLPFVRSGRPVYVRPDCLYAPCLPAGPLYTCMHAIILVPYIDVPQGNIIILPSGTANYYRYNALRAVTTSHAYSTGIIIRQLTLQLCTYTTPPIDPHCLLTSTSLWFCGGIWVIPLGISPWTNLTSHIRIRHGNLTIYEAGHSHCQDRRTFTKTFPGLTKSC